MEKRKSVLFPERGNTENRPLRVAYIESQHGPEDQYSWTACVTDRPTPRAMDGGHLLDFFITNEKSQPYLPDKAHPDYEAWISKDAYKIPVAGFKDGTLIRRSSDAALDAVIAQIKETCSSARIKEMEAHLEWHDDETRGPAVTQKTNAHDNAFEQALKKTRQQEAQRADKHNPKDRGFER
jgi:hypothetical protein